MKRAKPQSKRVPSRPPRVLFVHDDDPDKPLSSFFAHDLATFRKRFTVEVLSLYPYRRDVHLDVMASPAAWLAVARCDVVFAWFGMSAAVVMMASMLRKPSIVMAGGSDVVYVPEIDYGMNPARRLRYHTVLAGYRLARKIRLASHSSFEDYLSLPGASADKAQPLYLGVDAQTFKPAGDKQPRILSISYLSLKSIRRKGILTMIEAARLTPELSYRIGGRIVDEPAVDKIRQSAPANVTFLGYLDDSQLLRELQAAKVYSQLSYHEGFGMAVAEAMACECIPVVTERGSLPEVVGDSGFYVPVDDPQAAASAYRQAFAADGTRGARARSRVIERFDPKNRESALWALVEELGGGGSVHTLGSTGAVQPST
jgi:glycosyltransferase involved in cell wall biosynthesis